MRKNKQIAFVILLILGYNIKDLQAQDIHFSQFMMTPLQLNPSMAGNFVGDYRGILNHRNQWSNIMGKPFATYGGMFDMNFKNKARKDNFFGGGICVYNDKSGIVSLNTTLVNLSIAYHIKLDQGQYLSGGLQSGLIQRSINLQNLRFDSQFDGTGHNPNLSNGENFSSLNFIRPEFAAGISYTYTDNTTINVVSNNGYLGKKINIGASVYHFNSPVYNFTKEEKDKLALRYVIHSNNSFGIANTNLAIQPSGFIMLQRKATNIVLGSYFRYNLTEQSKYTQIVKGAALSIGGHYRVGDAFISSLMLEMGSFAFGFSYDINTSYLSTVSRGRGGYEISIRYISPNPFTGRSQARFN